MKQLSLLILFTFLLFGNLSAQVKEINLNEKYIEFEFDSPNIITIPKRMNQGDFYKVVVRNINLNNYLVEMQVEDTVYYSAAVDFPFFGSVDISSIEGIVGTFSAALSQVTTEKSDSLEIVEIKEKFKIFHSKIVNLDSLLLIKNLDENNYMYSDPTVLQEIERVLENERKISVLLAEFLKKETDKINLLAIRFLETRIASKALDEFNPNNPISTEEAINTSLSLIKNLNWLQKITDEVSKRYVDYFNKSSVTDLIKQAGDIDSKKILKEKGEIEKVYAEAKTKISQAKAEMNIEKVEKNIVSIHQLYNSAIYTSLPIQFTGEEAELKMSFIPKDSASNLQTYHLSPIKFGKSPWYWAVGPGMYYSEVENRRVGFETIQVNDSTQNFRVLREDPLQGEIGVSALFHAGYKLPILNEFIGIHGSVGTGVSLSEEIRARMLYGGGIAFGKKNHLTLNIGWATGYVDRVSSSFAESDYGIKLFVEKPSVLVKHLRTEVFYNIGYVFTF